MNTVHVELNGMVDRAILPPQWPTCDTDYPGETKSFTSMQEI